MNFLEPTPTALDLNFRLLGTPIRVHPSFWLFGALFGWGATGGRLQLLLLYIACFFLSILVHEMGHALVAKRFGEPSRITLFMFGGVAVGMFHQLRGWQRIMIALAGPAYGFMFLGLVWGADYLLDENPQLFGDMRGKVRLVIEYLIFMNLFWNVMNLLPIYPLDGGMVVREVCLGASPGRGVQISLGISFVFAALVAVAALIKMRSPGMWFPLDPMFTMIFFALMAAQSFMAMQQASRQGRRVDDNNPW